MSPKPHTRSLCRRLTRSRITRATRRLDRARVRCLPGCRRQPGDLSQALSAFTRAIRSHQRLARLAPSLFDATVMAREASEREERRRWKAECLAAVEKVYGPEAGVAEREAGLREEPLPALNPRTQRVVDREEAAWQFWLAAGQAAMEQHRQRRPHARLSLSQIARLFFIGATFGRLACGLGTRRSAPVAPGPMPDPKQALARIHGNAKTKPKHESTSG